MKLLKWNRLKEKLKGDWHMYNADYHMGDSTARAKQRTVEEVQRFMEVCEEDEK